MHTKSQSKATGNHGPKWSTPFKSCTQWVGVVQSPGVSCKASLRYISRANLRLSINLCVSTTISSRGGEISHHVPVHD
jgi:hypothetical protein